MLLGLPATVGAFCILLAQVIVLGMDNLPQHLAIFVAAVLGVVAVACELIMLAASLRSLDDFLSDREHGCLFDCSCLDVLGGSHFLRPPVRAIQSFIKDENVPGCTCLCECL